MKTRRVRAGQVFVFVPVLLDRTHPSPALTPGDVVRVVKLRGCPPPGTMGHCHVERMDGSFGGLVCVNSLVPRVEGEKSLVRWQEVYGMKKISIREVGGLGRGITRKRDCYLSLVSQPVEAGPVYWDDGSRDDWWLVEVTTGKATPAPVWRGNPWQGKSVLLEATPGTAVCSGGTFCGKPATVHFFVCLVDAIRLAGGKGENPPLAPDTPAGVVADWLEENEGEEVGGKFRRLFC